MPCSYCNEYPCDGIFASYCENCAMLRRLLKIHNSKKCVDILKRCLIRNEQQITNKINIEIKNTSNGNDQEDYSKPITRSKNITK